ncbi:MAG: hypothetical protein U1E53_01335 [Dongiaceae bacterium]
MTTNIAFLQRVIAHPAFRAGDSFTGFITRHASDLLRSQAECRCW